MVEQIRPIFRTITYNMRVSDEEIFDEIVETLKVCERYRPDLIYTAIFGTDWQTVRRLGADTDTRVDTFGYKEYEAMLTRFEVPTLIGYALMNNPVNAGVLVYNPDYFNKDDEHYQLKTPDYRGMRKALVAGFKLIEDIR